MVEAAPEIGLKGPGGTTVYPSELDKKRPPGAFAGVYRALAFEWVLPILLVGAAIVGINSFYWYNALGSLVESWRSATLIGLRGESRTFEQIVRDNGIDAVIVMTTNDRLFDEKRAPAAGLPEGTQQPPEGTQNAQDVPEYSPADRVRIGDARCCLGIGDTTAEVFTVAIADDRFVLTNETQSAPAQSGALERPYLQLASLQLAQADSGSDPKQQPLGRQNQIPQQQQQQPVQQQIQQAPVQQQIQQQIQQQPPQQQQQQQQQQETPVQQEEPAVPQSQTASADSATMDLMHILGGALRTGVREALARRHSRIAFYLDESALEDLFDAAYRGDVLDVSNASVQREVARTYTIGGLTSPLTQFFVVSTGESAATADDYRSAESDLRSMFAATIPRWAYQTILTRQAWVKEAEPEGEKATNEDPLAVRSVQENPQILFNPEMFQDARVSPWPAIGGVAAWLAVLLFSFRRTGWSEIRWTRQGILFGIAAAVVLALILALVDRLSFGYPDGQILSLPWAISLVVVVGCAAGFLHALLRRGVTETMEEIRETVLRVVQTALHPDVPLTELSEDKLNFRPIVESLVRFVADRDTRPPLVIGVNGPWGAGKSSVMGMLDTELRKQFGPRHYRSIWINAWRYDQEKQILAAILHEIALKLTTGWHGPWFRFRLMLARFADAPISHKVVLFAIPVILFVAALSSGFQDFVREAIGALEGSPEGKDLNRPEQVLSVALGSGVAGYVVWVARMLFPFRLRFKRFQATKDYSKLAGFVDEFAKEFKLYRQAIPRIEKFVVFIDDLDRCPPDKVVDVLKAINLVINSGDGADKTVFVIGFDQGFVLDSVELSFKDFTARDDLRRQPGEASFGQRYLKKMVTLSVSVPLPNRDQVLKMLTAFNPLSQDPPREKITLRAVAAALGIRFRRWWGHPDLPALAWFAMMVIAVVTAWIAYEQYPGDTSGTKTESASKTGGGSSARTTQNRVSLVLPPPLEPPAPSPAPTLAWILLAGFVAAAGGMGVRFAPSAVKPPRPIPTHREERPFVDCLKKSRALLPCNPRDGVRLVNSIRVGHEVQLLEDGDTEAGSLDEREFVTFSLMLYKYPTLFEPTFVEKVLIPGMLRIPDFAALSTFRKMRFMYRLPAVGREIAASAIADLVHLGKSFGSDAEIAHFFDPEKLARFIEVNRYILEIGGIPDKPDAAQPHAVA